MQKKDAGRARSPRKAKGVLAAKQASPTRRGNEAISSFDDPIETTLKPTQWYFAKCLRPYIVELDPDETAPPELIRELDLGGGLKRYRLDPAIVDKHVKTLPHKIARGSISGLMAARRVALAESREQVFHNTWVVAQMYAGVQKLQSRLRSASENGKKKRKITKAIHDDLLPYFLDALSRGNQSSALLAVRREFKARYGKSLGRTAARDGFLEDLALSDSNHPTK